MGLAAWHTLHYLDILHVPLTLSLVSRGLLAGTSIASPTPGSRWGVEIVVSESSTKTGRSPSSHRESHWLSTKCPNAKRNFVNHSPMAQ